MHEAELKHKLPGKIMASEDFLTASVFGILKYKSFQPLLRNFLAKASLLSDSNISFAFEMQSSGCVSEDFNILFWERYGSYGEPDLILECSNAVIVVEVKFRSGISGADQLRKYHALAKKAFPTKRYWHIIYLTADLACPELEKSITQGIENNTWWLSWYELEPLIREYHVSDEAVVPQLSLDLSDFLRRRKLVLFSGFSSNSFDIPETFFWDDSIPLISNNYDFSYSQSVPKVFFWSDKYRMQKSD